MATTEIKIGTSVHVRILAMPERSKPDISGGLPEWTSSDPVLGTIEADADGLGATVSASAAGRFQIGVWVDGAAGPTINRLDARADFEAVDEIVPTPDVESISIVVDPVEEPHARKFGRARR